MKPLKIYFKILTIGNGKLLKNKDAVNNLIVDVIDKNPDETAASLRTLVLNELSYNKQILETNNRFFISKATDIEVIITFLPEESNKQEQFYTQWRFVQFSTPYYLVQYLDEDKIVVFSEATKVLHTVKLDKNITIVADDNQN